MMKARTFTSALGAAALIAMAAPALADGGYEGGMKDAPAAEEGRKFALSFTAGGTSDYIFRGVSQTDEDPTVQASIDATYGILYAGVWASGVDFNDAPDATTEIDFYAGIKPVWNSITFDLGGLYYYYPQADEFANFIGKNGQLDYFEFKAGYSLANPWIKDLTTGTTLYYSPDYSFETGDVFTVESTAAYALRPIGIFTPTISGTYGWVSGDSDEGFSAGGSTDDEYVYWNAGLSLAVEKFTFDFRYHDTDINATGAGGTACAFTPESTASGKNLDDLCDERFVFTAKITLP